jgi:alpha-galactosidase
MWIALGRGVNSFKASVGVDDSSGSAVAKFALAVDGKTVWRSGDMHKGDPAKSVEINLLGKSYLVLAVDGTEKADWINARFDTAWSDPIQAEAQRVDSYILTPPSASAPHLNNVLRYGARPKREITYTIPCTGSRPVRFSAEGLPEGLSIDSERGQLTGQIATPGEYSISITATNAQGTSKQPLTIVIGDRLSLTPPMGWSSWNVWCAEPTQARILAAANAMVKFDLINHGFTYVNIDDGWQGPRGGKFNGIQPNEKFPDIHSMIREIHDDGLRGFVHIAGSRGDRVMILLAHGALSSATCPNRGTFSGNTTSPTRMQRNGHPGASTI